VPSTGVGSGLWSLVGDVVVGSVEDLLRGVVRVVVMVRVSQNAPKCL
jgi:hypothetical protein